MMHITLSKTPRARKYTSDNWLAAFGLVIILFFPVAVSADGRPGLNEDIAGFFQAVHGKKQLAEYEYYFGAGDESESSFEGRVCESVGLDDRSDACIEYMRCRWADEEKAPSYVLAALSEVLPEGEPDGFTVEKGPEGVLPYELIHVSIRGRTVTFYRVVGSAEKEQFGALLPIRLDGKGINFKELPIPEEMSGRDSCRSILTRNKE
jgi:hypothetical protein